MQKGTNTGLHMCVKGLIKNVSTKSIFLDASEKKLDLIWNAQRFTQS